MQVFAAGAAGHSVAGDRRPAAGGSGGPGHGGPAVAGRGHRRGDLDARQLRAHEPIEVDPAGDTGHRSARRVLPERPAVAAPACGRHGRCGGGGPVGDPQHGVAVRSEPRRVSHVLAPEVGGRVDHGSHAGPLVDATDVRLDPGLELRDRQPIGDLEIEHRWQVTGRNDGMGEEPVGLVGSVFRAGPGPREVVRPDNKPGGLRVRIVGREVRVDVVGPLGRLDEGELLAGRSDRGPVDRRLPFADVDALDVGRGRRWRG